MDAPIRVGVIGVGTMGGHHAGNLGCGQVSGATLQAVMDLDGELRAAVARRHGVDLQFDQTRDIIGHPEVDALLVAAPDGLHAKLAIECLEAGKPVFLEKPLATTVPDAERVVELETGIGHRMIQVGFMREFDRAHVEVKAEVNTGHHGRRLLFRNVHRNAHHPDARTIEDVVTNSMVHDIHSARWMMEDEIVEVYGQAVPDAGQDPGTAHLCLLQVRFRNGALGLLEFNTKAGYGYEVDVEISCEDGVITSHTVGTPVVRTKETLKQAIAPEYTGRFGTAYLDELVAWAASLEAGTPTGPSAWDGYMAMVVVEACIESVKTGQPVSIPEFEIPSLYR
ncbi:MAG: hypothetical protein F4Y08_02955 [Caldilineaceae bacterium SB0662_bin_9]|uniref:Inositol 2-dehydrogenase n=1 Tax=Caldilineaceae bacterium SB0662_bin_9 TaxID=2605258 RepID=A0A6B1DPW1_9CHLR|nr:hypothetical protein [Caldilineaceae bacterium SB0662_bin_9]